MLLPVDEGMYVSAGRTWFLSSGEVTEGDQIGLHRNLVDRESAIPYTGIQVSGDDIGSGIGGIGGMWLSRTGICVGDSQGKVINVTENDYVLTDSHEGSSMIRNVNGIKHFISVLRR